MIAPRVRIALAFAILTVGALVMLAVAVPTLFLARRFYSEVIGYWIGRAMLWVNGVRFRVHTVAPMPAGQTVFISNHTSTLDVFLIIALALPRTRYFMSGFLRKVVPLGIIGTIIRIFWTVPQEFPEERRRIFARAGRVLARTGDSVYLSPEGMRVATGEVGHFNKGAFHLATSLRAPIVPIYFRIPPEMDPGRGYEAKPGTVDIYILPAIDSADWSVDDVEQNRTRVRALYLRVHAAMREGHGLPTDLTVPAPAPHAEMALV